MAVSSNTVEIRINVTDENSAQAVGQVEKNVESLGSAGAGTGEKVAAGMDKIHGHSLTALDNVRLLRDDIGVRIPRSMEKAIASSQMMMRGIGAIGTGLLALGALDIGIRIFQGLGQVYERWLDIDGAIEKYNDQAADAAQKKFDENRSLQQVNDDLRTTNQLVDQLNEKRARTSKFAELAEGLYQGSKELGLAPPEELVPGGKKDVAAFNINDAGRLNTAHGQSDKDEMDRAQKDHERALGKIHDQATISEAGVNAINKARAAQNAADREAEENTRHKIEVQKQLAAISERAGKKPGDSGYVPEPRPNDYKQDEVDAKAHSAAQFRASQIEFERQAVEELARARETALEAGLRGEGLYRAKEQFEIAELTRKQMNSPALIGAVEAKYHAEQMRRLQDENREIQKMREQTELSGLTGVAKIQREGKNRISDIYDDPDSKMNPGQRLAAANEIAQQTRAQIAEIQQTFSEHVTSIMEASADRAVSGFARIHLEAQKQIADLRREAQEKGGRPEDLARGEAGIRRSESDQTADLARKNADETSQIEAEAGAKSLNSERQRTAAIEAEYEARLQKYEDWKKQELDAATLTADERASIEENASRREAAAWRERNAEMVEAAKQAREKMAGEFTSLFRSLDHPTEALKNIGEKAAGQAAAAMVQRMQMRASGSTLPTAEPGEVGAGNLWDKLMGRVAGQPVGRGGSSAHIPASGHVPDLASVKAIALSTAEIHIGSANLAFGGATGTPAGSPGAASPISSRAGTGSVGESGFSGSGSTSLLAPPASSFNVPEAGTYSSPGHGGGATGPMGPGAIAPSVSAYASEAGTVAAGAAGASGVSGPSGASGVATGIGDVQKGLGLVKQARGIFGAAGSTVTERGALSGDAGMPNLAGIFGPAKTGNVTGPSNGGMLGGGGFGANAAGAAGGAMGLFGAYEGNGGIGGTLGGAMSGMQLGMAVGGPIGAAVGAVGGAILGAIGFGGREKARVYDLKTVRPRLGNDFQAYGTGSMDYSSAYSDMQALDVEARSTLDKMGGSARAYYWDTVNGEIKKAEAKLTAEEKAGRSQVTMSAAQFDQGGWTGDFGSMATGPDSGFAHMKRDEFVVHEQPAAEHAGALEAIRAGASQSDMARYYGAGANDAKMPAETGFGGDLHFHVSAIDSRGVEKFFNDNGHRIRASLNNTRAENSGGSDLY